MGLRASFNAFGLTLGLSVALTLALPALPFVALAEIRQPFDASREFPNYFLPEAYRGKPASEIPDAVVKKQRALLDQALGSVFDRLVIPIVKTGETQASLVRYFPYLRLQVAGISKKAKVYASGGVVRAGISYLYSEMYEGMRRNPPVQPAETLARIISDPTDLPGIDVRGVGSDLDVLLANAGEDLEKCSQQILAISNSAETHYKARDNTGGLKRSIFTVGDVKDHVEQTTRSSRQGGSTLDLLSFDTGTLRFVEPEHFPGVVDDLVRGVYSYVGPESMATVEDAAKQTVRGLRPLLELPFLGLKDDRLLRQELAGLIEEARKGKLSPKVWDQFNKLIRNARFSGANNRIYRGRAGGIDQTVHQFQIAAKGDQERLQIIPEFVDRNPLTLGRTRLHDLPADKLRDSGALLTVDELIRCCSDKGRLYHGTPSIESGLAILRGGLFVSKQDQGTAVFGRGGYTSPDPQIAHGYAGGQGVVFELQIKRDPAINVLDWQKAKDLPEIAAIAEAAKRAGRDPFEVLARDYGIDIILNHHVLIQNTEAIQFPKRLSELALPLYHQLMNPALEAGQRIQLLSSYEPMRNYIEALGESIPAVDLGRFKLSLLNTIDFNSHGLDRIKRFIAENGALDPAVRERLRGWVQGPDEKKGRWALDVITSMKEKEPDLVAYLIGVASQPERDRLRSQALQALSRSTDEPVRIAGFLETLGEGSPAIHYDLTVARARVASRLPPERLAPTLARLYAVLSDPADAAFSTVVRETSPAILGLPENQAALLRALHGPHGSRMQDLIAEGFIRIETPAPELTGSLHLFTPQQQLAVAGAAVDHGSLAEPYFKLLLGDFHDSNRPGWQDPDPQLYPRLARFLGKEHVQLEFAKMMSGKYWGYAYRELLKGPRITHPEAMKIIASLISDQTSGITAALVAIQHGFATQEAFAAVSKTLGHPSLNQLDQFLPEAAEVLVSKGFRDPLLKQYLISKLKDGPGYTHSARSKPELQPDFYRRTAAALKEIGPVPAETRDQLASKWAKSPYRPDEVQSAFDDILQDFADDSRTKGCVVEELSRIIAP